MSNSRPLMLITGGSRGIGAATATLAAKRGYNVAFSYRRNEAQATAVVAQCEENGARAVAIQADVSDEAAVERLFNQSREQFGPPQSVIVNAGILETQCRFEEVSTERLDRVFNVNVRGAFFCLKQAVFNMSTRHGGQGGTIVCVSSRAAVLGSPFEYVDYAASKGALDSMTVGLAKEVAADGIRVNGVRPGFIYTEMHADGGEPGRVDRLASSIPLGRGGQAEEIAEAILWLSSDQSSYATGAFLDIAGGR